MTYRKRTLRTMPPVTRRYARLLGELESVLRKGKNLVDEVARLELDSRALVNAKTLTCGSQTKSEGGEQCNDTIF